MELNKLPSKSKDGNPYVLVEIPSGSQNKYEFDKDLGVIVLDRVLYSAVHYPADYGFVPQTRSSDGELLDAMVMVERTTFPGCLIETRLLGVLTIRRQDGESEHKLLGVPVGEPRFDAYQELSDVPREMLNVIENFFDIYKELEHEDYDVLGWGGKERAAEVLEAGMNAYHEAAGEK